MELVARATPDGHTLLANTIPVVANPALFQKLPFHPEKDFAPISLIVNGPSVIVVHPAVAVRSVADLIALAKAKPGLVEIFFGRPRHADASRRGAFQVSVADRSRARAVQRRRAGACGGRGRRMRSELPDAARGERADRGGTVASDRSDQHETPADPAGGADGRRIRLAALRIPELGRVAGARGDAARGRQDPERACGACGACAGRSRAIRARRSGSRRRARPRIFAGRSPTRCGSGHASSRRWG